MSEMLGNQYFMIRKFAEAIPIFESVLEKDTSNISIVKKLILCYIYTNQLEKAFNYFSALVMMDISTISDTDLEKDDCPCKEIIEHVERISANYLNEESLNLALGMLWLYCNPKNSLKFFSGINNFNPHYSVVNKIRDRINNYLINNNNLQMTNNQSL